MPHIERDRISGPMSPEFFEKLRDALLQRQAYEHRAIVAACVASYPSSCPRSNHVARLAGVLGC